MKNINWFYFGLLFFLVLFFSKNANAQCEGTCTPTINCKSLYFTDQKNPDPCPIVFCFDQDLVCGGNICYSFAPICSEINHLHTPPFSQICFRTTIGEQPIVGCEGCEVKTTGIRIYRKFNSTGPYASITLSAAEVNSFMNLLNGTGGGIVINGLLNDCEGNVVPSHVQIGSNPGGPFYCILN